MSFRFALQKYIDNPSHASVLFYDDDVVIINDAYPKSVRHYLILPRDNEVSKKHPFDAFKDMEAYEKYAQYVEKAKLLMVDSLVEEGIVASDKSSKDSYRHRFIRAGVHSIPSMANLHIHVISQDFHLPRMKNKKHYNSFTTQFFVDFDRLDPHRSGSSNTDFLTPDSGSDDSDAESDLSDGGFSRMMLGPRTNLSRDPIYLNKILRDTPLICVYCNKLFGNSMVGLKAHLASEFETNFMAGKRHETGSSDSDHVGD